MSVSRKDRERQLQKKGQSLKKAIDRKWPVTHAHQILQKRNIQVMSVSREDQELQSQKF